MFSSCARAVYSSTSVNNPDLIQFPFCRHLLPRDPSGHSIASTIPVRRRARSLPSRRPVRSGPVLLETEFEAILEQERQRVLREEALEEEDKNRGPGFWIIHTLDLPKDINHSEPTQIISYHFIKVPADRFYNIQLTDRPGDDILGLLDSDDDEVEPIHSPQFWYSKDCKTEEEYLEKKAAASLLKLRLNSELHDE